MTTDLFSLEGEVAVVLGGTGALGGAMASALAGMGARVAIVGRSEERGQERVRLIEAEGGQALFQSADALDRDSLLTARDAIAGRWGTVQCSCQRGGRQPSRRHPAPRRGLLQPAAWTAWQGVFDLNLVGGVLLPCQVWGETMLTAKRGSIINIASLSGMTPLSRVVAYSAAKAAVLNLTQFLAREWAACGIRVNALSPGFFPAEQNRALLYNPDGTYSARGAQIIGHTPLSRFGSAEELAGAVIWLAASRASSFVTGQNIVVDGGFSAITI